MAEDYVPFPQLKKVSNNFNLQGLNLFLSPFNTTDGEFIRLINVDTYPVGAKRKRAGYNTFLGTSTGSAVTNLFEWHTNSGTQFWLYKVSSNIIEYSTQGTGAWTVCGNGTVTAGSVVSNAVVNNTLMICDGAGSTRHTTTGTAFTNTVGAPVGFPVEEFQRRAYIGGTPNILSWSNADDSTNWSSAGTSDSSSIKIQGPGALLTLFKNNDRLTTVKNTGVMHQWDGFNLYDLSTNFGPTSHLSLGSASQFRFYLNRRGYFSFDGINPQVISNQIQPQIFNNVGSGIGAGTFDIAPAAVYKYNYMCAVGTVTDDITRETVSNAWQVFDFRLNEWRNYSLGTVCNAFLSYKDSGGTERLIFGDNLGQCYTFGGTTLSDNGLPIESIIEYVYHGGIPEYDKAWDYGWWFFSPGCKAKVQVAISDTFTKEKLRWNDLGDLRDGIAEFHFKGAKGRIMFVKIIESSTNSQFTFYGHAAQFRTIVR